MFVYGKNFIAASDRDLASFKRDLANRASPLGHNKRTLNFVRKTIAWRNFLKTESTGSNRRRKYYDIWSSYNIDLAHARKMFKALNGLVLLRTSNLAWMCQQNIR